MSSGTRRPGAGRGARGTALRALADRLGIIAEYIDQTGTQRRRTTDETRIALLAAMGIDASTARAASAALEGLEAAERATLLAPVRVVVAGSDAAVRPTARVPVEWPRTIEWTAEVETEDGGVTRVDGTSRRRDDGEVVLRIDALPPGYQTLRVNVAAGGETRTAEQSIIVAPPSCPRAGDVLRGQRAWGTIANLYTVRSARNWGAGDFTDLGYLARWTASVGGSFVGVNPLHALRNRGADVSPYSPVSRRFRSMLYLDVDRVPELAASEQARELVGSPAFRTELAAARSDDAVSYERVASLKRRVLAILFRTFQGAHDTERADGFRRFVEREGDGLRSFALFSALDEHFGVATGQWGWESWPEGYREPSSAAVASFAREHADAVDLHAWMQFELDRQLADAAAEAQRAGLAVGLYQDLAIGTSPSGSDLWADRSLFLRGASIGAPPDPLAADGQNWGLPPIDPRRLAAQRYRYWIDLVRGSLRHAGALRIDHVMGLFRQFWIPEGRTGAGGAYVRFPSDDLLGILALESTRAGAIVVGEDLGTVPPDVPPALRRWGILSSKVLYFEVDAKRQYRPAVAYEREALATANTHDMATLAGFWRCRDIELRREVGQIDAREAAQAERDRAAERRALLDRLVAEGLLPPDADPSEAEIRATVHAFLRRTPSWLVGLSLDDLLAESEPVNLPGVGPDQFPSWTRRMSRAIESLTTDVDVTRALGYERMSTC